MTLDVVDLHDLRLDGVIAKRAGMARSRIVYRYFGVLSFFSHVSGLAVSKWSFFTKRKMGKSVGESTLHI
jgi:hypothetical protein